jgi:hypothetical protein
VSFPTGKKRRKRIGKVVARKSSNSSFKTDEILKVDKINR